MTIRFILFPLNLAISIDLNGILIGLFCNMESLMTNRSSFASLGGLLYGIALKHCGNTPRQF